MTRIRRITANLPADLVRESMKITRKGITGTLIEGLERLRHQGAYDKAMALRGKVRLRIDLEASRERRGR